MQFSSRKEMQMTTAAKRPLTPADYRRFYAIRNAKKAKVAAGEQAPKAPRHPNLTVESFDCTIRTITNTGISGGENPTAYMTIKDEGQPTVMVFGQNITSIAQATGPIDVVMQRGRGPAKIVAIVHEDGTMLNEDGEMFDLEAALAA